MSGTPKSKPTRILIIDDDPLIRALLVATVRKDCLVAVAADGEEGFRKAMALTPDVAVIDVNMPGWDGLKTLEAFREHPKLRNVKIIMLTADSSKQTVMAAIQGGANDYLIKTSFSKTDFYKKLNRLVPDTIGRDFEEASASDPGSGETAAGSNPPTMPARQATPIAPAAHASTTKPTPAAESASSAAQNRIPSRTPATTVASVAPQPAALASALSETDSNATRHDSADSGFAEMTPQQRKEAADSQLQVLIDGWE